MSKNILLLHGAIGAAIQFDKLKKLLSQNFSVFTIDFEGHGLNSNSHRAFSIEHFTENLKAFLNQHQDKQFLIFGYSMGGFVALYQSAIDDSQISGIVTLGTKFHWDAETSAREVKMLNPEKIKEKIPAFASLLKQRHTDSFENVLMKTADMMIELGKKNPLTSPLLSQIKIPIKLMVGENDTMVTIDETQLTFHSIPNAQFQLLTDTVHPIEKVNMDLLCFILSEFIDQII